MFTAQERIAAALERDCRHKIPFKLAEELLQPGIFHTNVKPVSDEAVVGEALAPLHGATLSLMREKGQRRTTVDVTYLSGGGAALVYGTVKAAYPQTPLITSVP